MKAGIIVDNEFSSDARVKRQAMILSKYGIEVHVLCFGFKDQYNETEGLFIERIRISKKLKDVLFFFLNTLPFYETIWAIQISRFIKNHQPDILHVHDLYMSKAAFRGIKKSGRKIPMILDLHENYPFQVTTYNWTKGLIRRLLSRPHAWKKKEKEHLDYAGNIIVLSSEYRDQLLQEYPHLKKEKFAVFPNVPDLSAAEYQVKTKVENPFTNGFPIMLYYGIIAERRGIFDALSVFSELVKSDKKLNFLLIGPVDKKDRKLFNTIISREHFGERVIHIPWIESKDFPGWLEISDICIAPFKKNPQHESGIANKIYDYMLGGKPLIVSDCLPQKNLVEKYDCGIVYSDNKELENAIATLADDPFLRRKMGMNGKHAIINTFNTESVKQKLISTYRNLVEYK
jgi:glycosyltransferase involved in cell wall biosynthesis